METEVLLFQVDDKRFGVPSGNVKEVVRAVKLSPLPQPSDVIEGLLNLRGNIVPVMDLRALFGLATRDIQHTDHLVVVEANGRLLTLRVDRAVDLVRIANSELQSGQTVLAESGYVRAVGKVDDRIVHILDVDRLVGSDAAAAMEASQ